jgi:hypothetical protein
MMRVRQRISRTAALLALVLALVAAAALLAAPAYSAANHNAQGTGSTAQFLCPSGFVSFATINFQATKSKGTVTGFFQIFGGAFKSGSIRDGTINENSYTLTGVVNPGAQCGGSFTNLPAEATITGECGEGVTIHYRDTHGEVGDFLGNVICN